MNPFRVVARSCPDTSTQEQTVSFARRGVRIRPNSLLLAAVMIPGANHAKQIKRVLIVQVLGRVPLLASASSRSQDCSRIRNSARRLKKTLVLRLALGRRTPHEGALHA